MFDEIEAGAEMIARGGKDDGADIRAGDGGEEFDEVFNRFLIERVALCRTVQRGEQHAIGVGLQGEIGQFKVIERRHVVPLRGGPCPFARLWDIFEAIGNGKLVVQCRVGIEGVNSLLTFNPTVK